MPNRMRLIPLSIVFHESDFIKTAALFRGTVMKRQEQVATILRTINWQGGMEGDS